MDFRVDAAPGAMWNLPSATIRSDDTSMRATMLRGAFTGESALLAVFDWPA